MPRFLACLCLVWVSPARTQWTAIPSSPPNYIHDLVQANGVLYLAHLNDGVFVSTDSTRTWQAASDGLNTTQARSVYQILASGDTLFAATVDGIYRSTNRGSNWYKKSSGITIGPGATYEFCESIARYDGSLLTGAWNGIYRSTDSGEQWTLTNISGEGVNAKNFTVHNGIVYGARENINDPGAYTSTNGGISWQGVAAPFFNAITFRSEPGKLWVGTIVGVWLSTDDGSTWVVRNNGLTSDPYSSSMLRINGTLVTALKFGGSGVFQSTDDGLHWTGFGEGLPFLSSIEKLVVFKNGIIAATSSGLWQRAISEVVTDVARGNVRSVSPVLLRSFPDPFNPATTIAYQLSALTHVSLKVFDALGREVVTLVDGIEQPGLKTVRLDGTRLSGGVYFCRLEAGGVTSVKKLLLLK